MINNELMFCFQIRKFIFNNIKIFYSLGPPCFPIVGNMPQVKHLSKILDGQHLAFMKLAKDFNTGVLGLKLGHHQVVVVLSTSTIKQVLTEEEFEGRPEDFFMKLRCFGAKRGRHNKKIASWIVILISF